VIVISDTSPINYLCRIGQIDILHAIFGRVIVPTAVARELGQPATPKSVRDFIAQLPDWLIVQEPANPHAVIADVGAGERQAIALALELSADYLIVDDLGARAVAEQQKIGVIGTLGVLKLAANRGLLPLDSAIDDLRLCEFYLFDKLIEEMLGDLPRKSP
jgi:uncharacterized protein